MHEAALTEAALPADVVILGLLMQPYSLGHELFLIRQNNPLAVGGEVLPRHIYEAALVCSENWEGAKRLRRDLFICLKIRLWKWRTRKANLALEIAEFRNYRAAGAQAFKGEPPRQTGQPQRTPGTPFLLRLNQWLIEHLRLSESAAWNYPLGLAQMRWQAYWESEGAVEVQNEGEAKAEQIRNDSEARIKALIAEGMEPIEAWNQVWTPKEETCRV